MILGLWALSIFLFLSLLFIAIDNKRLNRIISDFNARYKLLDSRWKHLQKNTLSNRSYFLENPKNIARILILKLDQIGDFVLVLPILNVLMTHFSTASFDIATSHSNKDLLHFLPRKINQLLLGNKDDKKFIRALKKTTNYDLILDLRSTGDTQRLIKQLKSHYKVGFHSGWSNQVSKNEFYLASNWKDPRLDEKELPNHVYRKYQYVLEIITGISYHPFSLNAQDYQKKNTSNQTILFHFKSNDPNRSMPLEYAKECLKSLINSDSKVLKKFKVFIIGGKESVEDANTLCQINSERIQSLCDKVSLSDLFPLIENSRLLIAVNSAPMHIAALLKRPLISLFSYNEFPDTWGPFQWGKVLSSSNYYPCAPCRQKHCYFNTIPCMTDVSIDTILKTVIEELSSLKS
jgi:ADP-heptose:LPS heptosyltransferase